MHKLFFILLVACGGATPTPTPTSPETVDATAMRFATAALHDRADEFHHLALTFDEVAAISSRASHREDWDDQIERVRRRFAEAGARDHLEAQRAEIVKQETLGPDDRLKRATEAARVKVFLVAPDGTTREEHWVFIRTPGGWRYSPKA